MLDDAVLSGDLTQNGCAAWIGTRRQERERMSVNLKSLIGKLNDTCRSALEAAAGLCLTRTHYDVDIEHLFLKLSEVHRHRFPASAAALRDRSARLSRDLTRALDRLKTGNAPHPGPVAAHSAPDQ